MMQTKDPIAPYEPLLGDGYEWYLEQLGRPECEPLSREDEHALAVRVRAGDARAREALVTHNLRLVVSIAKKHGGRGVELLDLIAAGNRGLMVAIDRFDPARRNRISTFATYWIRQHVQRLIENEGRAVRLPVHMYRKDKRERLAALAYQQPLSLDEPREGFGDRRVGWGIETEETNLLALIEDGEANVEQRVEDEHAGPEAFRYFLHLADKAGLTERERRCLALRFAGGDGGEAMTLEQVGRALGVTRERARQIEGKALRLLRQAAGVVPAARERERAQLWAS